MSSYHVPVLFYNNCRINANIYIYKSDLYNHLRIINTSQ